MKLSEKNWTALKPLAAKEMVALNWSVNNLEKQQQHGNENKS